MADEVFEEAQARLSCLDVIVGILEVVLEIQVSRAALQIKGFIIIIIFFIQDVMLFPDAGI